MAKAKKVAEIQNDLSFEQALEELEGVVGTLETGQVPLEESLKLLKRGMSLIERCEGELAQAEAVLEQLIATPDGELRTVRIGEGTDETEDEED
jgi:exodeoxyribonuclease VII small subunit